MDDFERVPPKEKEDFDLAIRFRDIQRYGNLDSKEKEEMSERAILAVIERARESLGPIQKPYRYESLPHDELISRGANATSVELDIEETLMQPALGSGVHDPVFSVRFEKDHGLVLLLDTSLSMKGEKLALLGVTVAAVCESVASQALAIFGFDSEIHVIKEFNERITPFEAVKRTLSIPPGGFTNISKALFTAKAKRDSANFKEARVILVSDGRYTEGQDPIILAKEFRFVYPVKIGKDPTGRQAMRDIADQGQGKFLEVREMRDLPQVLLHAVRMWVK